MFDVIIDEIEPGYFFSPAVEDIDSRPADVHTFDPRVRPDLYERVSDYIARLEDKHHLFRNYQNLDMSTHDCVSMFIFKDQVVGFASMWHRTHYGNDAVRILNRIYQDPVKNRVQFTRELSRPCTLHTVEHQLIHAYRRGYSYAFISRELRAKRFFREFINALDTKSTYSWEYREGPYWVAPGYDNSCMQSIGVASLQGKDNKEFFERWKNEIPRI